MKTISTNVLCRTLLSGAAVIVLTASFGCQSADRQDPLSFSSVANDPSPELQSTTQRPVDVDRSLAYMKDVNKRSFWDDLSRTFYTDHPSRLSPYPIMSTSGEIR